MKEDFENIKKLIKDLEIGSMVSSNQYLPVYKSFEHGAMKIGVKHIDNKKSILKVLKNFGLRDNELEFCASVIDLLQITYQSIDDTFDETRRSLEEIYFDEVLKVASPILLFFMIMDKMENKLMASRIKKSFIKYSKEFLNVASSPSILLSNISNFFSTKDKIEESKFLLENQILRATHVGLYFNATVYIFDQEPIENDIEKINSILKIVRGIELLTKDIDDLKNDLETKSYNPFILISMKYKGIDIAEIIKELNSVEEPLFQRAEYLKSTIKESKYFK